MIAAFFFVLLLGLDQASKVWVRGHVPAGSEGTNLVPGLFDLTYAPNRGVAFSTFAELPATVRLPLLLVIPAIVTLGLGTYALRTWKQQPMGIRAAFVLILSGAVGNLIDRALFGEVTDFVRFRAGDRVLFVNNFADDYISVGAVLLGLLIVIPRKAQGPVSIAPADAAQG
jgi:signal peptidase II